MAAVPYPRVTKVGCAVALALAAAACTMPSERYGLPPVSEIQGDYPNINLDPAQKSAVAPLDAKQRAEAEAQLERSAGKKPKAPPAPAN